MYVIKYSLLHIEVLDVLIFNQSMYFTLPSQKELYCVIMYISLSIVIFYCFQFVLRRIRNLF